MMRILTAVVVGLATIGLAMGSPVTAEQSERPQWGAAGSKVMLTACVVKAQDEDTFILTNVADVPVHPRTMGRVVYWLDRVDELARHVGHQIRIEARIDKVEESEIEVKSGEDSEGGWYVEIEGPGRDVKTAPDKVGVTVAGREGEDRDISTTLVRLDVDEVVMVARSCPAP